MLKDKTILITGATGGIGSATARLAKQYGARLIVHGRDDTKLKALATELEGVAISCDVADRAAVKKAIDDALKKVDRIDVLINNAGTNNRKPFMEATEEDWLSVFRVNVMGTVYFCQAVIPQMQKNHYGRIVNLSSLRAYTMPARLGSYAVTKAGIITLTSSLAKEYAPDISVNAVAPGLTDTPMIWDKPELVKKDIPGYLLKRIAKPEEIAEAILFLASDRASFITGQTLLVDGGFTISGTL